MRMSGKRMKVPKKMTFEQMLGQSEGMNHVGHLPE